MKNGTIEMQITFRQAGKRYRYEWILKGIDYRFEGGRSYAVKGPNGSGKSTFLKLLSGHLSPSKGEVIFMADDGKIPADEVYRSVGFAAPYIDLIDELTLREALVFHQKFKPLLQGLRPADVIDLLAFSRAQDKQIRHFSSGMKQRLKLALALCSDTPVLLLDEPTTNLDKQGTDWYLGLVERFAKGRLTVVASNVEVDYVFCEEAIDILNYK
jgi:ABC-type multidrug transport system ATPase subunit